MRTGVMAGSASMVMLMVVGLVAILAVGLGADASDAVVQALPVALVAGAITGVIVGSDRAGAL